MTNAVASMTMIVLAAPAENGDAQAPEVYRLRKCFAVVQFDAGAKGRIVVLPEGAELRMAGPSALCKCFEVVCKNQRYNIFREDLLGPWSTPIKNSRSGSMRARAVGACA
jgi:hypothetical protein